MEKYENAKMKSGDEAFHNDGKPLDITLLDFWRWHASDLMSNALRGIIAEFIVASALNVNQSIRHEWDSHDVLTNVGLKIEVKSGAYLQAWHQQKPSLIRFDIRPTIGWDPKTNKFSDNSKRQADLYVFCLFTPLDETIADPLNVTQWDFFVLPSKVLDEHVPSQKSIGLKSLKKLNPIATDFRGLKRAVNQAMSS